MGFLSDIFTGKIFNRGAEPEKQKEDQQVYARWLVQNGTSFSYGASIGFGRPKEFPGLRYIKPTEKDGEKIAAKLKEGNIREFFLNVRTKGATWTGYEDVGATNVVEEVRKALPESMVTRLHISGSWTHQERMDFIESLPKTHVKDLEFNQSFNKEELEKLGEVISKMPLRRLEFNNEFMTDEELKPVLQNLPMSLEQLDLSSCARITDESMKEILPYVGRSNLQHLALRQTGISDKYIPELLEKAKDPNVAPIYIETLWTKVSDHEQTDAEFKFYRSQKRIHQTRTAMMTWVKDRRAVMDDGFHVSEAHRSKALLSDYAHAGRLPGLMQRAIKCGRPFTADQLMNGDNELRIRAPLRTAAERLDLDKVFSPNCWVDANEMQKAWDSLRKDNKIQLDGKDGRPDFETVKKEVGQSALTAQFQARLAQRNQSR